MARKRTGGARKKTTPVTTPKNKKVKAATKKTSPKKRGITAIPGIPLSDEDTLPSATDLFDGHGLGSPDCVPIAVKKKNTPVEIITLDNEDTIVASDCKLMEMTFSEEKDDQPMPSASPKHNFDFRNSFRFLSSSVKNQKPAHETDCSETFEMTFSVENIKKEPLDYDSDFDCGNLSQEDPSIKDWTGGKLLSADEIKREVVDEDEDDVPLSMLCSNVKNYKISDETKTCQVSTESKVGGMSERVASTDSQGTLNSGCPIMIPNIKTEKIDLYDDTGTVSKTKPVAERSNTTENINLLEDLGTTSKTKQSNVTAKMDLTNDPRTGDKAKPTAKKSNTADKTDQSNDVGIASKTKSPVKRTYSRAKKKTAKVMKDTPPPKNLSANLLKDASPPKNLSANLLKDASPPKNLIANLLKETSPPKTLSANLLNETSPPKNLSAMNDLVSDNQTVDQVVCDNSLVQSVPVSSKIISEKTETNVVATPSLDIKIKQEPLSDSEDREKDITNDLQVQKDAKTVLKQQNSKSEAPDVTVLGVSVKIKQEPLSDSEDVKEIDSGVSDGFQGISKGPPSPSPSNSSVSSMSSKGNLHEKEVPTPEVESSPLENKSLVVTSASDEFRKEKNISASPTNSNSEENSKQAASSVAELLSKESVKNASLNVGTLEKLNPTERVAAEVISSLPAEKLQELIRRIAEARKLDLKPVLEDNTKSETNCVAKNNEDANQSGKDSTTEYANIKSELSRLVSSDTVTQQPANATTQESLKCSDSLDVKPSASCSSEGIKLDDKSGSKPAGVCNDNVVLNSRNDYPGILSTLSANAFVCNSEGERRHPAIDMNQLMSAENLQNILKTASSLRDSAVIASSSCSEVLLNHSLAVPSVTPSEQTQVNEKDQKLLSLLSTDFLRTVIKNVEASATQSSGESQIPCKTESTTLSCSEQSNVQKCSDFDTSAVKQEEKSNDTSESPSKGKSTEKIKVEKTEDESTDESPAAKRCKTENVEDDCSQVSMECSQVSESENEDHSESGNQKKRKLRRVRRGKRVKRETPQDSCSKQPSDEISHESNSHLVNDDQNSSSVKSEKSPVPKAPDSAPEKSVNKIESNSVRKKLNDSIVEVIKLSGKGQAVPSKGKGSCSKELEHSKLKRKAPSPKRKSADKESALFDVENDPDIVSSKASNKVQRFASRNEFLTKEMLPDEKSVKGSQKQKFKWFKGSKKSEPANIQEGHLLVKSPEIDDIHFGDTGNKIEVVVRGGHINNASQSLDPRLNRANSFPGKYGKLNIEEYKEKYRNSVYTGSEFQQTHQMPVSTTNYNPVQQTVFQTNSFWNQPGGANPHPSSVEMTEAIRNPVFSTFQQPVATQPSFFPNNSPAVLPSSQPFVPNQRFNLPLQSVMSQQNLPNITPNISVRPVPPAQNLLNITQNPVQPVPPPAQNLPGVARNVPVQPVRPIQNLTAMTPKVPPVSPLSSTIPPLTFPPPPIRNHPPQRFPPISSVASPPPVDAAYPSRFQGAPLHGCFPPPENSLPVQSFAPPLPPQPPPNVDVPPPPPLPPPDFFPPPPPASPPPDSSPTKSMSLASSSPSLSPPASSPPLQFETSSTIKPLSIEFSSTMAKNSTSSKFLTSPRTSYSAEQHLTRAASLTPEQLGSRTPSSTPELFFSRPPSSELNDISTRDSLQFPKTSAPEVNSASTRHSVTSVDTSQGRTQMSDPKFSSKSAITYKDMTKANSSSKDLLFLILSWSVSWLPQQIQITDPPPITEKVKPVEELYTCFKDYYDTYFPLLLHETWETIFLAWRQAKVIHYFCNVINHKPEGRLLEIRCDTIISGTALTEGRYPAKGFLVIIKFGLLNSSGSTKMYGYVSQHSVRPFEIKSDFSNPCLKYLVHQSGEEVSVLSLTIKTAYKCDKIDFAVLPRIQIVHSLRPILKQYDALLNLRVSPLCKGILSADTSLCKIISLSKQKNPSAAVVVEEIANLILKPHPSPQIIVIEALPGTDKINTLVKLIQRLKSAETSKKKTQLLLCSRTNEVVDEVGCHLVLSQEEEDEREKVLCVRLGKMSDIHPEMRKYSLEDLAAKEAARVKKQQLIKPDRELAEAAQRCAKTEFEYKTLLRLSLVFAEKLKRQLVTEQTILSKKQKQKENLVLDQTLHHQRYVSNAQLNIIKTSDVILSTVANCHQTEVDNACGKNSPMPLDCCIIDDASQCTELETLLPLLYGSSKLVLLGDPNISPRVLSKTASTYKYDVSYYQRVFNQLKVR